MKKMHILKASILATGLLVATPSIAAEPITGNWVTEDKDAIIKIGKCGNTICGRIHKFLVAPPNGLDQKDINNPNKKLRSRKLLGIAILSGFRPDGKIWRGKVYDPKSGKTYRSEVKLLSPTKLKMKGCIGPFCQGQNWTRAR
ncbi:MAG: DUF2147 domain-containing protein [Parasphingorhabdus sp.]|uniref:DUF2147 domain-containing protein n=1 Tax=Parasphingorhabdus sp. TaxID=2709688 RepID=UPI0032980A98